MRSAAGVARNEINLQIEDNNTLMISGERVKEEQKDEDRVHRYKRVVGRFLRRFR
jgi:HSP20 family molecular chaperone IbpA